MCVCICCVRECEIILRARKYICIERDTNLCMHAHTRAVESGSFKAALYDGFLWTFRLQGCYSDRVPPPS